MRGIRSVGFALAMMALVAAVPAVPRFVASNVALTDSLKTDPETGLALDENLLLVKAQCTACHSSRLIRQSRFSREQWTERIRWMQRTQNLWDLGESEPAVLTYLVKHYGPASNAFDGRREPIKTPSWHKADSHR